MRSALCVLAAVTLTAAACDDGEPVERTRPIPTVEPACPNQSEVVEDDAAYLAGRLEGDITGDEMSDDVSIAFDDSAEQGCQAFVVVATDAGPLVAPIDNYDATFGLDEPGLVGLSAIDDSSGAEVLVTPAAGASTQFVTVFTAAGGVLRRVEVESSPGVEGGIAHNPGDDGMFAYGGSVGHLEAVDCTGDGLVVVSAAFPVLPEDGDEGVTQPDYDVTRHFYEPTGATWELLNERTETANVPIQRLSETFAEFATAPFGNCPAA